MNPIRPLLPILLLGSAFTAHAASILVITNSGTTASHETDIGSLLTGAGHSVAYASQTAVGGNLTTEFAPGQSRADYLNSFDGVVVARSTTSSNFNNKGQWALLTTGIVFANPYATRGASGDGAGLFAGGIGTGVNIDAMPDPDVTVSNSAHPIWSGVNTTGNIANLWETFAAATPGNIHGNGSSVGQGVVLGSLSTSNQAFLVAWETGSTQGTGETLGGRRVNFSLVGDGNNSTTNTTSLTADGEQAFVNAVNWVIIPEPSSAVLAITGTLMLCLRRRRD